MTDVNSHARFIVQGSHHDLRVLIVSQLGNAVHLISHTISYKKRSKEKISKNITRNKIRGGGGGGGGGARAEGRVSRFNKPVHQ